MKLKSTILTVFALLAVFGAFAQQGGIKGHITTSDGIAAGYVSVSLRGAGINAISNERGDYQINRVKAGSYTLVVSSVGLQSQEKTLL